MEITIETRNIYDGCGDHGNKGGDTSGNDRHGSNSDPGFHKSNGNKKDKRKELEIDTTRVLDATYCLRGGGSCNSSLGYEIVLDRELTKNVRQNLVAGNRKGRG
ncbi:uncharacterized protein LOC143254135 [Tachypleus tridentatus]|uniref:uncharacterized protein LOC143254135 n=1 Tax=Tachypleus tridentatus TaxID=6853 RepID=UPI003FD4AAEF